MASIPIPRPMSSSEKLAETAQAQGDLKSDDQSRPRAPTPFQEISGSSREGSRVNSPERLDALPPSDIVKSGDPTETPPCEEGQHEFKTKHGVMGILMAIALFPCGLICFFRDKEKVCVKCGAHE